MSLSQMSSEVREIFADVLEVPAEEVRPEMGVDSTPNWDSFRHLQLILALENEFGVQFDPGEIPSLHTVAQVLAALEKKGVRSTE